MYIADLHIHSHYSRATSKDCTPESLDLWARRKGIDLLGTGDFTHPAWREELRDKLVPAEEGLYCLKRDFRREAGGALAERRTRFVVSGEISSIYKKNGRVRKVHSVILLPSLDAAERLSRKLETIGNIHSDGRPILGLDCRDLLEITLELCPDAVYIPAHIWTPHFSLFGAFSGFDTIEECFGDLTPHIHALETGLSSDPPMNWRISALDAYQLISNSDAHSPAKLGREANLFDSSLSYPGMAAAIQEGKGLHGTIEFFPEEGKYHYDGHRRCRLCLSPKQTVQYGGACPVCGRKITIGVQHRVEQLADREEGYVLPGGRHFESLVPLPEIIAAATGSSAAGAKTLARYEAMVTELGPEFTILRDLPLEEIAHAFGYLTAEGIRRLRKGQVRRNPGYDGEYGVIQVLNPSDLEAMNGQMSLFTPEELADLAGREEAAGAEGLPPSLPRSPAAEPGAEAAAVGAEELNEEQAEAVREARRAMAVIAGPGSGKTRTLISRILYLMEERGVKPSEITAVTFTNKAAEEMKNRLKLRPGGARAVRNMNIGTFHSICHRLLADRGLTDSLADPYMTLEFAKDAVKRLGLKLSPGRFLREISLMKTGLSPECGTISQEALDYYQEQLHELGAMDFDDLLLRELEAEERNDAPDEKKHKARRRQFSYLLVDEFQDISPLQYRLIQAWSTEGRELFVIGDPDQSIYGFRGSDAGCFQRLEEDFPGLYIVRLTSNYRSTRSIVDSAMTVISHNPGPARRLEAIRGEGPALRLVASPSAMAGAVFAAKEINRLIGGIDMLDVQSRAERPEAHQIKSFSDIAILYRTHRQAGLLEMCLQKEGIPYVVTGREEFLEEDLVRGTICFFRCLADPTDRLSSRLCQKLIWEGDNAARDGQPLPDRQALEEHCLPLMSKARPQKLLKFWMEELALSGCESLQKLTDMAVFHKTMADFLESLAFGRESDLRRSAGRSYESDAVTLATLHGSKGLEYPVVLLYGVNEGLIPLEAAGRDGGSEEERRLFYVGMTRAMEELILLTYDRPSAFLEEIPEKDLVHETVSRMKTEEIKQMSLFDLLP